MSYINKRRFCAIFSLIFCISTLLDFVPSFAVTINQTYVDNMNKLYLNNPKWSVTEYKNEINKIVSATGESAQNNFSKNINPHVYKHYNNLSLTLNE